MKRGIKNLLLSLLGFSAAPMLTACYGAPYDFYPEFPVTGTVTDEAYNPIAGISITLTNGCDTEGNNNFTTDAKGRFGFTVQGLPKIVAEDIDGEENGGLFRTAVRELVSESDRYVNIVMERAD